MLVSTVLASDTIAVTVVPTPGREVTASRPLEVARRSLRQVLFVGKRLTWAFRLPSGKMSKSPRR
jgi:hypothetical protein